MYYNYSQALILKIITFNYSPHLYIDNSWIDQQEYTWNLIKLYPQSCYFRSLFYSNLCKKYTDLNSTCLNFDKTVYYVALIEKMLEFVNLIGIYAIQKIILTSISKTAVQIWKMVLDEDNYSTVMKDNISINLPSSLFLNISEHILQLIKMQKTTQLKQILIEIGLQILSIVLSKNRPLWQRLLFKLPKDSFSLDQKLFKLSLSEIVQVENFVVYIAKNRMLEWADLIN